MSNGGLIGFPSGRGLLDGAQVGSLAADAGGDAVHYVNLDASSDALARGLFFRYIPRSANTGSVALYVNGMGPFLLVKQYRTHSTDPVGALIPLSAGDIVPGHTLEVVLLPFSNDPGTTRAVVVSGIQVDATDLGLNLMNAPDAAFARSQLGLASGATTTVGTAATRNVGLGASDLPANSNLGSAAYRAIGVASGNVPEITDGSGNLNAALNIAKKDLTNLSGSGIQRTLWASCAFSGAGSMLASFNFMGASRTSIGRYALSFPSIGGSYFVEISLDLGITGENVSTFVLSGSRAPASCTIITVRGNSSPSPFDPDRISAAIFRIES